MLEIIARGLVMGDITDSSLIILITEGRAEHWLLPGWMRPYIGKRIVISLEEERKPLTALESRPLPRYEPA